MICYACNSNFPQAAPEPFFICSSCKGDVQPMNIQQYWTLPPQQKNEVFKQVIIPRAWCEIATCHKECSIDGATCYWCQMGMCSEHTAKSHHGKKEIVICAYCRQWELDTGRRIEEGP